MDRDEERGRGLGLDESFFPESTRSWNSTRYFKFRKNSNSILPPPFTYAYSLLLFTFFPFLYQFFKTPSK
jgi:hypothetical protein